MLSSALKSTSTPLHRLQDTCERVSLDQTASRLDELQRLVADDLSEVDAALQSLPLGETQIHKSAEHVMAIPGKYVRPTCVLLSARLCDTHTADKAFTNDSAVCARPLAIAAELVHNATLLHDDVVDMGETRRGRPAARTVYGNAASIFAGDWLLVRALQLVSEVAPGEALTELLAVIEQMIDAEAIQLEHRGQFSLSEEDYFSVLRGKTAALFTWASRAGGRVAELGTSELEALGGFGENLGVAFQITDDLIDYEQNSQVSGKTALSDIAEGKATLPLIYAFGEDPTLSEALRASLVEHKSHDHKAFTLSRELGAQLANALQTSEAGKRCRTLVASYSKQACAHLEALPASATRDALSAMTEVIAKRHA